MYFGGHVMTFQRNLLFISSEYKKKPCKEKQYGYKKQGLD
jgi:hypothetical protein